MAALGQAVPVDSIYLFACVFFICSLEYELQEVVALFLFPVLYPVPSSGA